MGFRRSIPPVGKLGWVVTVNQAWLQCRAGRVESAEILVAPQNLSDYKHGKHRTRHRIPHREY